MELLGQRTHGLGEQREMARRHGKLTALGADYGAGHADDIAAIEAGQGGPVFLRHIVHAAEELDIARRVAQYHELDLALAALGHHATADLHHVIGRIAIGEVGVGALDIADVVLDVGMLGIRVMAGCEEGLTLGQAHGALVGRGGCRRGGLRVGGLVLCHGGAPYHVRMLISK